MRLESVEADGRIDRMVHLKKWPTDLATHVTYLVDGSLLYNGQSLVEFSLIAGDNDDVRARLGETSGQDEAKAITSSRYHHSRAFQLHRCYFITSHIACHNYNQ